MDFLIKEITSIWYLAVGLTILIVGMVFSDLITDTVDKAWKKKD